MVETNNNATAIVLKGIPMLSLERLQYLLFICQKARAGLYSSEVILFDHAYLNTKPLSDNMKYVEGIPPKL